MRALGRRLLGAAAVLLCLVAAPAGTVAAHTELESSSPADGEVVGAPVAAITLQFTADVSTIPDGFEVLDPSGARRVPSAIEGGGRTHVLHFEPALAGGPIGVRWAVAAADGHVIEGTFSFVVDAPAPTTAAPSTTAPARTTAPATAAPATTAATSTTTAAPTTIAPAVTAAPPTVAPPTVPPPPGGESLDDFLSGGERSEPGAQRFGHVGRILGFVGAVVGLGAVAFVALVLLDRSPDRTFAVGIAALAGAATVVGAVMEGVGHAGEVSGDGLAVVGDLGEIADVLSSTFGAAVILRFAGALVLTLGCSLARRSERSPIPSPLMLAGAAALLVSFTFDGHTVSAGPRPLHALVDIVHVAAASIWAGGVVVLAALAWRHRDVRAASPALAGSTVSAARRPVTAPMLEAGLHFSVVATWALLAVAAAGGLMALMILDDVGELTSTPWGRTLLVKLGAVAVAVAFGLYNRMRALPALTASPDDPALRQQLRGLLTAEAIVLVFVVVVTTWLVGAAV